MSDQERLHALDAVRGLALLLGIALHAAMPYIPGMPKGSWAVLEPPSATLAYFFVVTHIFRMTLFFFIAGYFARLLLERRGVRGFLKNRCGRILVPFLLGWPIFGGLTITVLIIGILQQFGGTPPKAPAYPPGYFPLTHLWFLYLLMIFYGVTLLLRGAIHLVDRSGGLRTLLGRGVHASLSSCLAPLLLAIPGGLCLWQQPGWIIATAIPTPDQNLIPTLPAFVGFGTAILFGWMVHRGTTGLAVIQRRWPVYFGIALVATALLVHGVNLYPGAAPEGNGRLLYALAEGVAAWSWSFAITGAALTFCAGFSPVRRYMADASYWMYLAHLPLVMAIGLWLGHWPMHWAIKFPLTLLIAFTVLLVSYHYLVRPSWIGKLLNGRRYPIGSAPVLPPPQATPSATA